MLGHMIAPEASFIGGLHEFDALAKRRRHGAVGHFDVIKNTKFHLTYP